MKVDFCWGRKGLGWQLGVYIQASNVSSESESERDDTASCDVKSVHAHCDRISFW